MSDATSAAACERIISLAEGERLTADILVQERREFCRHYREFSEPAAREILRLREELKQTELQLATVRELRELELAKLQAIRAGKTVRIEYDMSPAETEARLRQKLQEMGWVTPEDANGVTGGQKNFALHALLAKHVSALKIATDEFQRIADCDWVISLPDRMDAVREIGRNANARIKAELSK